MARSIERSPPALRQGKGRAFAICAALAISAGVTAPIAGCCRDCAALSQAGALAYSGPSGARERGADSPAAAATVESAAPGPPATDQDAAPPLRVAAFPDASAAAGGSGFYVDRDGHLLTTWQAVRDCRALAVLDENQLRPAALQATSEVTGLAVLATDAPVEEYAIFRSAPLAVGEPVQSIAHPVLDEAFLAMEASRGWVRSVAGPGGLRGVFETSAPVIGRASGGPILDEGGGVVGIGIARATPAWPTGVQFAAGATWIFEFLRGAGIAARTRETMAPGIGDAGPPLAPRGSTYTVGVVCFR